MKERKKMPRVAKKSWKRLRDFQGAEDTLCTLIQALDPPAVPKSENQLSGYALHLLRNVEVPIALGIWDILDGVLLKAIFEIFSSSG